MESWLEALLGKNFAQHMYMCVDGRYPCRLRAGGIVLGLNVSLFLHLTGRITGLSGIFSGLTVGEKTEFRWKVNWTGGMILGACTSLTFLDYFLCMNVG